MPDKSAQTATLSQALLEQFACPVCFGALSLVEGGGQIRCMGCGRGYPVIEGIPVLIAERAVEAGP